MANFMSSLPTIHDAARAIHRHGERTTIVVQGQPGVGKTAILSIIAEINGDQWRKVGDSYATDKYVYVYVDCSNLQYGDLQAMVPDRESRQIEEYVGGLFRLDDPRPKVIMFDEVLKLPKSMKPIVTRIKRERTVGSRPLTDGSIVFGTSNMAQDGVGDTTQAHEGNRITFLPVHMTRDAWLPWAHKNNLNPTLLAWVQLTPELFDSYLIERPETLANNPYVWNPKQPRTSFVSLRSLVTASGYVDDRLALGNELCMRLIEGCLGTAAAESLRQFILLENEIVQVEDIIKDPMNAPIPHSRITSLVTLFKTVHGIKTQDDLSAVITYVQRMGSKELETAWAVSVMKSPKTDRLCSRNSYFTQWRLENGVYLRA